jgi:hypothetical protein
MIPPTPPAQQEWILTQSDWNRLKEHLIIGCTNQKKFLDSLRPHTSTPEHCISSCPCTVQKCPEESRCSYLQQHDLAITQSARDQVLDDIIIVANFEQNRPITPFMISGWCNKLRTPTTKEHP